MFFVKALKYLGTCSPDCYNQGIFLLQQFVCQGMKGEEIVGCYSVSLQPIGHIAHNPLTRLNLRRAASRFSCLNFNFPCIRCADTACHSNFDAIFGWFAGHGLPVSAAASELDKFFIYTDVHSSGLEDGPCVWSSHRLRVDSFGDLYIPARNRSPM